MCGKGAEVAVQRKACESSPQGLLQRPLHFCKYYARGIKNVSFGKEAAKLTIHGVVVSVLHSNVLRWYRKDHAEPLCIDMCFPCSYIFLINRCLSFVLYLLVQRSGHIVEVSNIVGGVTVVLRQLPNGSEWECGPGMKVVGRRWLVEKVLFSIKIANF